MGVRSRLAKVFGNSPPAAIQEAEAAAGMTPSTAFSPGAPIGPYDGYSRTPRSHDFLAGRNISARPRTHERVSFDTLRGLVEAYDVASMCIWHRIDSIRSLDWSLVPADGTVGDVADAIAVGMAALEKPDRDQPFASWLAAWLFDILAFDAGTLYRMRNRAGRCVGLRVVDGTTIAPLLDEFGNTPQYPAEAYVQYAQGLPWNWQTTRDIIYTPFRKIPGSPYGRAPLESILLNANTDLRFQAYFLQRFTEGNVPQAFASAPEGWSPDQIEQFQEQWDAVLTGDQAILQQVKFMPPGFKIEWSNEKDFSDVFSLHLMRKTAAAFHVVPSDLGFTESVNKSSGESQADVQHRVGDLPLIRHVSGIITSFLQNDLGLPLRFSFDLGEEQADQLQQAQADKVYVEMGAISASEVRAERWGLPEPDGIPVPRFILTSRSGPVPLSSLYAVAGEIDPESAAPKPGAPLPQTAFQGVEGTQPSPPIPGVPLAEQIYGPSAIPATPPTPVAKEGDTGAPTAGITTATGIVGYDLIGQHHDEDDHDEELAKAELAAFRKFRKARARNGQWRDFEFQHVHRIQAHRLNDAGRLAVRKAAGDIAVAGLAVRAVDTGRVLMLQRALDEEDPASGTWEFPGGHCEGTETPLAAAAREWSEETGSILPFCPETATALAFGNGGSWTHGIYQGFVYDIPAEAMLDLVSRDAVANPDDPDGDLIEAVAWWDPAQLPGNPAVRLELLDSLDDVMAALGIAVTKAASGPKGDAPAKGASADWPGWQHDMDAANYWAKQIAVGLKGALSTTAAEQLTQNYLAQHQLPADSSKPDKAALTTATSAWLTAWQLDLATPIAKILPRLHADGYLIGLQSAKATAAGKHRLNLNGWTPGDTDKARRTITSEDAEHEYSQLADAATSDAQRMASTQHQALARTLANGLLAGTTAPTLAKSLRDTLGSITAALGVATTEITRSSSVAAFVGYRQVGVTQGIWLLDPVSGTCPTCIDNASADPRPIGAAYPSGDSSPPVHPNCRCSVGPA